MSNPDFYARVARKFGGYHRSVQRTTIYRSTDPEQVFDHLVLSLAGHDRWLLDLGLCGWAQRVAAGTGISDGPCD